MAKTAEQTKAGGKPSKDTARHLRQVRRKQGLSRAEVARSAGLTRRELAAYERGRIVIPESDLWCLAGSCGVDVGELLPGREPLKVGSGLSSLAMGDSIRRLRDPAAPDGLLREYLSMIYELRNLPPGSRVPLREPDLVALADALGGSPEVIEARLVELIGASHEEAARLRAMILPPMSLSAAPQSGDTSVYRSFDAPDPQSPVVDFFSAPRPQDPFSPQPSPLEMPMSALAADAPDPSPSAPGPSASGPPTPGESDKDPFGMHIDPLSTLPRDPFAVPGFESGAFEPGAFEPGAFEPGAFGVELDDAQAGAFDARGPGEVSEPAPDPFAFPIPPLRPDPFGLAPTAPNDHDGIDGFVVDVLDGPLTDAATTYAAPDGATTDWASLRDAAAIADGSSGAVMHDPGWLEPAIDEIGPEPIDTTRIDTAPIDTAPIDATPILWRAEQPAADMSMVRAEQHAPTHAARFEPAGTNWQIGGLFPATSMADDGALALHRADTRWALSDLVAEGDVTIEMVFDYSAGAGFGVLFRADVDERGRVTGYSFDLDPVTGGGGYLLQQWADNRPHWRPIMQVPVTSPSRLYGLHMITLTVQGDRLTVWVDDDTILTVATLSRASVDLGREPCRGSGLGVHAGATTELTVDTFRAAQS